jgi:hypothetical protein
MLSELRAEDGTMVGVASVFATGLGSKKPNDWSGYLMCPSDKPIKNGLRYRLKVPDGRCGEIRVVSVTSCDPIKTWLVTFEGLGRFGT